MSVQHTIFRVSAEHARAVRGVLADTVHRIEAGTEPDFAIDHGRKGECVIVVLEPKDKGADAERA